MRRSLLCSLVLGVGVLSAAGSDLRAADKYLGVGVHYWETVDNLDQLDFDIDGSGSSFLLSYQSVPDQGWFSWEVDLEYFSAGFAGALKESISPQFFVLVGHGLYGGVGIGITYSDSFKNDFSDPYFAARLGFAFSVLPQLRLDIHANYQADAFSELDEADTDSITLGVVARFRVGRSN